MSEKLQKELILFGKFLSGIVTLCFSLWFFGRAPFNEKVNELMDDYIVSEHYKANHKNLTKDYVDSPDFKYLVDKVISDYEEELKNKDSSKIGLRKLLADKMGIAEDEVHIELGRMFKAEKILFKDLKIELKRVIKRYHPELNIN